MCAVRLLSQKQRVASYKRDQQITVFCLPWQVGSQQLSFTSTYRSEVHCQFSPWQVESCDVWPIIPVCFWFFTSTGGSAIPGSQQFCDPSTRSLVPTWLTCRRCTSATTRSRHSSHRPFTTCLCSVNSTWPNTTSPVCFLTPFEVGHQSCCLESATASSA